MNITIKSAPVGIAAPWFLIQALKGLVVPAKKCSGKKEGYFVSVADLVRVLKEKKMEDVAQFWAQTPLSRIVFI